MIKSIHSDHKSFKEVRFASGFNVVLAERVEGSTDKDSRNGLGKSALVEIIHFCLGGGVLPSTVLQSEALKDWTFTLELTIQGKDYLVSRNTTNSTSVVLEGDFSEWPIKPQKDKEDNMFKMKVSDWNVLQGHLMFGLPIMTERKYVPTFRSLVSYFMRKGVSAFNDPFKHYPEQKEWDIQVNNACLLGLNWEYASDLQIIKDKEKTLAVLRKAAREGLLTGFMDSLGGRES